MNYRLKLWRGNRTYVRANWGTLDSNAMGQLKFLTTKYCLSLGAGEIQRLNNHWYVTHAGLLGIAQRRKCFGIRTQAIKNLSEPTTHRWVFRATVYRFPGSAGFVGYGDADPSNVSLWSTAPRCASPKPGPSIALCAKLMESASARSRNWARNRPPCPLLHEGKAVQPPNGNGSSNGQPRLRDQLCLLIRKHQLDATLVKRYAADFCGTEALRDASRDLVEAFISHLAEEAAKDRAALDLQTE